jgi:hypothetical protein
VIEKPNLSIAADEKNIFIVVVVTCENANTGVSVAAAETPAPKYPLTTDIGKVTSALVTALPAEP